jgi:site-specific recombinase XerD
MCTTNLDDAVRSYTLYCKSKGLAEKTLETYSYALKHLRDHLSVNGTSPPFPCTSELRAFIQSMLDKGLSRGTIRIRMRAIRAFCNFLTREHILEVSPMDKVEIPKVPIRYPEIITNGQARRLMSSARRNTWTGIRNRSILGMFLDTGVRLSELIGLNLEDVDLRSGTVRIRSGKGDKERHVYMGRALLRAMRKWIEVRGFHDGGTPFFLTKDGNRLELRNVERIIERITKRAKMDSIRITPHILRHTFATHYIQNGGDPFSLQRILGHSDIKTTMIYVNLAGVGIQEAHAKASPVDRMLGR